MIKSDGKDYLRTVATDDQGTETTTDTELTNNGKEIVVTDYAALVYAQALPVPGGIFKPQLNLEGIRLDEHDNVVDPGKPLFYNTKTQDRYLYYLSDPQNHVFAKYSQIRYNSDGNGGKVRFYKTPSPGTTLVAEGSCGEFEGFGRIKDIVYKEVRP